MALRRLLLLAAAMTVVSVGAMASPSQASAACSAINFGAAPTAATIGAAGETDCYTFSGAAVARDGRAEMVAGREIPDLKVRIGKDGVEQDISAKGALGPQVADLPDADDPEATNRRRPRRRRRTFRAWRPRAR